MSTGDRFHPAHDDVGAHASVPAEFHSPGPAHLRDSVRRHRGTLPAEVAHALLDAAHALEAGEDAFAVFVDQKHALQRHLAQTESNLRAALALRAHPTP
ncbi:hypothetical protein POK33_39195 [Burkholderia cenocepacia]|uniref:hypothetical protein n=1 Tax=Burkholderia cenocepacia TaxID=95486 RepID=UPI0023B9C56F|nr:hypothetical protein [Burkholderia cenocepacia]MDF0506782.1 hypothetical protein [Burkholderia cenocepacia]